VSFTRIRCWNRSASLHKTSTLQHRIDSSNNCPATCRALRGFAIVGFPFRTQKRICYSVACDKERSCCARKIDWPAEYDFAERKKGRRCFWILNALRQRDKERRIDMNFAALQYTLPSYPIKARRSSLFDRVRIWIDQFYLTCEIARIAPREIKFRRADTRKETISRDIAMIT